MTKFIKNILIAALTLTNFASFAAPNHSNDYDADYYEDEGRLLFKVRSYGINASAKQKSLPTPPSATPSSVGALAENGYGTDTATSIFLNDNMAVELSLGVSVMGVKSTSLNTIANNYNGTLSYSKKRSLYMIPLTLTGQYHMAPFGVVRPYVGGGYHGAYIFTKAREFKINHGYGLVLQAGVDFVAKDDTLINVDVRQYFLNTKVSYKGIVTGGNSVSSKVKINPFIFSVGIGFMF